VSNSESTCDMGLHIE